MLRHATFVLPRGLVQARKARPELWATPGRCGLGAPIRNSLGTRNAITTLPISILRLIRPEITYLHIAVVFPVNVVAGELNRIQILEACPSRGR